MRKYAKIIKNIKKNTENKNKIFLILDLSYLNNKFLIIKMLKVFFIFLCLYLNKGEILLGNE